MSYTSHTEKKKKKEEFQYLLLSGYRQKDSHNFFCVNYCNVLESKLGTPNKIINKYIFNDKFYSLESLS